MADEQEIMDTPTITEPKSTADVEIESLKKQIADMQSRYDKAIAEYQAENRKLYTLAINDGKATEEPAKPSYDMDRCETVFYHTLGIGE